MMIPMLLLMAALGVTAVVLLLLFWRYADRGVKLAYADQTLEAMQQKLDDALEQQRQLTARVEHLEAIVTSEAWDALHEGRADLQPPVGSGSGAVQIEDPADPSAEANTGPPVSRQRSR